MNIQTELLSSGDLDETAVQTLRIDLAAAFQLAVEFDWHESVGNHFSAAVSADGRQFLLNPKWKHFSEICASDLLLLDADDKDVLDGPDAPDSSAWCIHGAVHRSNPAARVMLHLHPPYTTALAALKDPRMYPIDQNTARFFNMGIDNNFGGIADDVEEGDRIAKAFGNHDVLMMGSHGIAIAAETVAEAFELMYFFERSAKTLMLAYASGQPLNILSDEIAEKTAEGWAAYAGASFAHFDYLKRTLDKKGSNYRQ